MCGIGGVIFKQQPQEPSIESLLHTLADSISHRGPNSTGTHVGDRAGFLNVRLAIVDIAGGSQPMYTEDGRYGIVYNGEVYNHDELRKELENKGYRFKTHSDTEVVLNLFHAYGTQSFSRLNGMFGACIWDEQEEEVYLVRDHVGIKPLYIYEDKSQFVFSSEIRGILALREKLDLELAPDARGIQDYLLFRYIQAPFTCIEKIRRVEAGTYLRIRDGHMSQFRYWDVEYKDPYSDGSAGEVLEEMDSLLQGAVRSQLMGEVPIGVLLSGGLDSSAIAYAVHKLGANLTTYNIGFPEVNEFEYSRAVANAFDLDHVEVLLSSDELINGFDEVMASLDEPIADPACFPLYKLCEELKKKVIVVLSGEGGDELFGGYPQYSPLLYQDLPKEDRFSSFLARSWYFMDAHTLIKDNSMPPHEKRWGKYFESATGLNRMLAYDMKTWMPENLMMKADKIAMWHSLEGRFPFLDKDLLEFSMRLPEKYKIAESGETKWILRELMRHRLPEVISTRPKMGFSVPVPQLLMQLKGKVLGLLCDNFPKVLAPIISQEIIASRVRAFYEKGEGSALQVWTWFILAEWFARREDLLSA